MNQFKPMLQMKNAVYTVSSLSIHVRIGLCWIMAVHSWSWLKYWFTLVHVLSSLFILAHPCSCFQVGSSRFMLVHVSSSLFIFVHPGSCQFITCSCCFISVHVGSCWFMLVHVGSCRFISNQFMLVHPESSLFISIHAGLSWFMLLVHPCSCWFNNVHTWSCGVHLDLC